MTPRSASASHSINQTARACPHCFHNRERVTGAVTCSPALLEKSHPDLFCYGIHGVETLFTVMGIGRESVVRNHTVETDVVVRTLKDGRIGTFRGRRSGQHSYGGMAFGEEGEASVGPYTGYLSSLVKIVELFGTGIPPFSREEILEIYTLHL